MHPAAKSSTISDVHYIELLSHKERTIVSMRVTSLHLPTDANIIALLVSTVQIWYCSIVIFNGMYHYYYCPCFYVQSSGIQFVGENFSQVEGREYRHTYIIIPTCIVGI